jgi:hypothetical protein
LVRIVDDLAAMGEARTRRGGMTSDTRYRGARPRELPRANRTYGSGRTCAADGCSTKLSIYNKWQFCWQHEPLHTYVARGKRRSRKEMQAA